MQDYQDVTNKHLEQAGRPERIDVRSYEERGIEQEPTQHLGRYAHQLEQQGIPSVRGNINRAIEERNRLREEIDQKIARVEDLKQQELHQLEAERQAAEWQAFQERLSQHRPLQQPRPLTPDEVAEYQRRAAARGYHAEKRQILASELGKPGRQTDDEYAEAMERYNARKQAEQQQQAQQPETARDIYGLPAAREPAEQPKKSFDEEIAEATQRHHEQKRREREREDERGQERDRSP